MPAIKLKRVYDKPATSDGYRVLVDRIWPRGVSKKAAAVDLWAKDLAPSTELRKWFGHDPERWAEFAKRYRAELKPRRDAVAELRATCRSRRVTLLFGAADVRHNQAVVLKRILEKS
jgi:uncharacterized protein YeaO (DUF488 family)